MPLSSLRLKSQVSSRWTLYCSSTAKWVFARYCTALELTITQLSYFSGFLVFQ